MPPEGVSVPEQAIIAFERTHGLRVTVKDPSGLLAPYLAHDRAWHRIGTCSTVKAFGHQAACVDFCHARAFADLAGEPDGRVRLCHAGFIEWLVPGLRDGRVAWLLFAGVRRPARGLTAAAPPPTRTPIAWARAARLPATVGDDDAWTILEGLRQLQARLAQWVDATPASAPPPAAAAARGMPPAQRRARILELVGLRHRQPFGLADLADALGLSRGRACRVVRESCGASLHRLLTRERLRTAERLLRHTAKPIGEVAAESGFPDVSRFHRAFRAAYGETPGNYRRWPPP